jgi:BolA protein
MRPTLEEIRDRLRAGFPDATALEVHDDSAAHAGHAGAKDGAGHFRVLITSRRFENLCPVARHRLVYDCVADWMPHRIHALSLYCNDPTSLIDDPTMGRSCQVSRPIWIAFMLFPYPLEAAPFGRSSRHPHL